MTSAANATTPLALDPISFVTRTRNVSLQVPVSGSPVSLKELLSSPSLVYVDVNSPKPNGEAWVKPQESLNIARWWPVIVPEMVTLNSSVTALKNSIRWTKSQLLA